MCIRFREVGIESVFVSGGWNREGMLCICFREVGIERVCGLK